MPKHEIKICARCNKIFECKAGDISHCQCNGIQLSVEEKAFIEMRYDDCLCAACLMQLKSNYILFKEKYFL